MTRNQPREWIERKSLAYDSKGQLQLILQVLLDIRENQKQDKNND